MPEATDRPREGAAEPTGDQVRSLVAQVRRLIRGPWRSVGEDAGATLRLWVARIDALLSAQLAEVLHDPAFQRLEAAWRGLHYLVHQPEGHDGLTE